MKDGLRFVDSDMHIMEPPDLFDRYLDPAFKHRVSVPVGADGRPKRGVAGLTIIDGLPTSDMDLQQYRKRVRPAASQTTQPLSGSRLFDTGRLDFAIERDYNAEAQVMGMELEGATTWTRGCRWRSAKPTTTGSTSSPATALIA